MACVVFCVELYSEAGFAFMFAIYQKLILNPDFSSWMSWKPTSTLNWQKIEPNEKLS